jgi:Skp family chaperone for outer membrane proteins
MKKIITYALVTLMAASFSFAQEPSRVGTVNMERLMNDYVDYQSAVKRVEGAAQSAQEEVDAFKAKLGLDAIEAQVQELQQTAQNPATADLARQNAEAEAQKLINDNQAKIQQLNAYGNQLQQQNQQNRNLILNPFQLKMREAIIEVAKDKGFDLIVPIAPQKINVPAGDDKVDEYNVFMGNILYASDSIEITDSVIAVLNAD